jgi:hypothetical protein
MWRDMNYLIKMRGDYINLTVNPILLKMKKELLNDMVFFVPVELYDLKVETMYHYNKAEGKV